MLENKVKRLVEAFSAPDTSHGDAERTTRKAARLLSSNTQYGSQPSLDHTVQSISQLITENDRKGHEKSLHFLEIAQKLQRSPHLLRKAELLKLLQLLSANSNLSAHTNLMSYQQKPSALNTNALRTSHDTAASSLSSGTFSASALNANHAAHAAPHTDAARSRFGEATHTHYHMHSSSNSNQQSTQHSASSMSSSRLIGAYATSKLQKEQYMTELARHPLHRLDTPCNDSKFVGRGLKGEAVDELLLIRDILYSCQGIETQFIETRDHGHEFEAKSNLRLLPSHKRMIRRLCLVGTLHEKLSKFIKRHRDYQAIAVHDLHAQAKQQQLDDAAPAQQRDSDSNGLVLQSFVGAVDEELTNLYQLFACLHEKLDASLNRECAVEEKLTLQRLSVWFEEPLQRLCLLHKFCSAMQGGKGGQIISQIYKFCRSGNEFEHNFSKSVLNEVSTPMFEMIAKWIIEGVLLDPFHEFFIVKRENVPLRDLWKKKYVLVRKYIPIFMHKKLAQKIYSIGRNLNFIRVCCKDNQYEHDDQVNLNDVCLHFDILHLAEFEEKINKLAQSTDQHLMSLMRNKFKVMKHAEALRNYLLLGQGDFIQQLLMEIGAEMNKNAATIKLHEIQSKLESAMLQSNALYHDNDIKQRLRVKLLSSSSREIGWNVFTLHYDVDLPLNIVFNESVLHKYHKIFVFLIKIKFAKSVLNEAWMHQMRGSHAISVFPDIHYIQHCGSLVRNSMNELLQIFESYFMFDVLDASWKAFQQNANDSKHMDGLMEAHSNYVNQMITKCFLNTNDEQTLLKPFQDILLQIHQFSNMYQQLFQQLNHIESKRQQKLAALGNVRDSYVVPPLSYSSQQDAEYEQDYHHLRKQQNEMIFVLKSFHNKIAKLLALPKTNQVIPEYLERLLVQLDFNDFHANAQQQIALDLPINPPPFHSFHVDVKYDDDDDDDLKEQRQPTSSSSSAAIRPPSASSSSFSNNNSNNVKRKVVNIQADDMLSKLNAALDGNTNSKHHDNAQPQQQQRSFVPNFVFPSFGGDDGKNKAKQPNEEVAANEARSTALSSSSNKDWLMATPLKSKSSGAQDIVSKYNLGTPKIDSTIPRHLLPTPLQSKTSSKTGDVSQKYLLDDSVIDTSGSAARARDHQQQHKRSRSTSPPAPKFEWNLHANHANDRLDASRKENYKHHSNGSGYIDDDDVRDEKKNDESNQKGMASPSGIKFSFGDPSKHHLISPIPFARNFAKIDSDEPPMDHMDKDQWSKLIPTPLLNQMQKTKSYRK